MKSMRKIASLLLALVMILSLATTVFADGTGPASITISNAAKGEKYAIYKVFGATVSDKKLDNGENVSISYTGEIPSGLVNYFQKDGNDLISVKAGVTEDALFKALKAWASSTPAAKIAEETAEDATLTFSGLEYGYYVITSTQGGGSAVTVDSTKPDATVVDKNTTVPKDLTKTATVDSKETGFNIGDTITYTVRFTTANWYDNSTTPKQIEQYTITDTHSEALSDLTVTSIKIDGADYKVDGAYPQFVNNEITIPWVDDSGNSKYKNGAVVEIIYTAKLTDKAAIDGAGNSNHVSVSWTGSTNDLEASETVYTYAIALKKVDQAGAPLAGATFQFPFYVKDAQDTDGAYIYAGTAAGDGLINAITTPASGVIIVKGVKAGTYDITETAAPAGYNKVAGSISVEAKQTGATTTDVSWYIDENGNKVESSSTTTTPVTLTIDSISAGAAMVVNKTGAELPSTGGVGTTMFYTLGSIMVLCAVVLLVTKKRMRAN